MVQEADATDTDAVPGGAWDSKTKQIGGIIRKEMVDKVMFHMLGFANSRWQIAP